MANYLGVDWASNGWVAAELDDSDELAVGFYPTVWNLWHERDDEAEQMLVDIPVGLPDEERRECDRGARALLGERSSSVFSTPVRNAVYEDSIEDAKTVQVAATGDSISNQSWAIVPRIREVDTFLRETDSARELVRESHPELCFDALSDGEPVGVKSNDDGIERRTELLCDELAVERDEFDRTVRTLTEPTYAPRAGRDDVLDAIVLAVTAKQAANSGCATVPETPPTDDAGLPMEIVYPSG